LCKPGKIPPSSFPVQSFPPFYRHLVFLTDFVASSPDGRFLFSSPLSSVRVSAVLSLLFHRSHKRVSLSFFFQGFLSLVCPLLTPSGSSASHFGRPLDPPFSLPRPRKKGGSRAFFLVRSNNNTSPSPFPDVVLVPGSFEILHSFDSPTLFFSPVCLRLRRAPEWLFQSPPLSGLPQMNFYFVPPSPPFIDATAPNRVFLMPRFFPPCLFSPSPPLSPYSRPCCDCLPPF